MHYKFKPKIANFKTFAPSSTQGTETNGTRYDDVTDIQIFKNRLLIRVG